MSFSVPSIDEQLLTPSPELAAIVGPGPISRKDAVARAQRAALRAFPEGTILIASPCPPLIASLIGPSRVSFFGLASIVIMHLR